MFVDEEDGRREAHTLRQLRDRSRDVAEAARVVASVAAHQADAVAVLVGEDAPPVDLLLVHPSVAVEQLADERGGHRGVLAAALNDCTAAPVLCSPAQGGFHGDRSR
jgi:hypothetical protein